MDIHRFITGAGEQMTPMMGYICSRNNLGIASFGFVLAPEFGMMKSIVNFVE